MKTKTKQMKTKRRIYVFWWGKKNEKNLNEQTKT
jgi:hypothetical protein